jgi:hypothetical protein
MGQTTFSVGAALSVPDQPCIGLPTNPVQMTTAARFCGLVAAYQTASSAENDSAKDALDLRADRLETDSNCLILLKTAISWA